MNEYEVIDLSFMELEDFSITYEKLMNIKILDLSHNHLTSFPEVILTLKSIEKVDLSWNHIMNFPPNLPLNIEINRAWNRKKSK